MTPAIERMEHAHTGCLIGPRAGLYDRADDHFQDPSADGVKYHGDQDSHIRIQKEGKVVKAGKSDDRYQKGTQSGLSVAGAFDHSRGEKVHQDLDTEIYSDQQADLIQGNAKLSVKGQKQQRRQIIYNGLGHIAQVTAVDGMSCL